MTMVHMGLSNRDTDHLLTMNNKINNNDIFNNKNTYLYTFIKDRQICIASERDVLVILT